MKRYAYILVLGVGFLFTACGGSETTETTDTSSETETSEGGENNTLNNLFEAICSYVCLHRAL